MTVAVNDRSIRYVAAGGETAFPFDFIVFAGTDLLVTRLRGTVTTTLTLTTDYTVSGLGVPSGGTVTLTAAALAGDVIAIVGAQPNARTTDFTEGGDLLAAALNRDLDRLWIGVQQLDARLNRQITFPATDPAASYVLPPRGQRINRLLGFDAAGDLILSTGATIGGVNVSSFIATLLDDADAATARGTLGAASAADVTASVNAALAAAVLRNGSQAFTANMPAGGFRITGLGAATAATDAAQFGQIGAWLRDNRVVIQERRPDGTDAGSTTAGSWQQRGLTLTEVLDSGNLASVSGATFTLGVGTWDVRYRMPISNSSGGFRGRLFNVTAGAAVAESLSESGSFGGTTTQNSNMYAEAAFRLTLATTSTFRLEYFVQVGAASFGLGTNDGILAGEEIYTTIDAMRLAA